MVVKVKLLLGLIAVCASCTAAVPRSALVPSLPLVGADGETRTVSSLVESARWTVLVFFSPHCDCLTLHEARLRELAALYGPRGVQLLMIDSEVRGSIERDRDEGRKRGYSFPILLDPGAKLADSLRAEYATYSVILDSQGRIRYRGGIDTDATHLHADATPYLRSALEDLLQGRAPRVTESTALGCALQKW